MKIAMSDGRSSAYAAAALNADDAVMVGTWPVFGAAVA